MNLADCLQATVSHYGARLAVRDDEGDFTWTEFGSRVRRLAALLRGHGVEPGQRFGMLMANGFRNAELLWAGYWSGGVPAPVNWRLAPPEIETILDDAGCELLVVDATYQRLLERPELTRWRARAVLFAPPGSAGDRPNLERDLADAMPLAPHPSAEHDDALLLYTGGTTGRSKGVRLAHRNIVANGLQNGLGLGLGPDDSWLHVAPMFHSADLLGTPCTLLGGGHVYLPQFTGRQALQAIERHRPTATVLPPTMLRMVMDEPEFERFDTTSLTTLYYGSSPMPVEWIRDAIDRFPHARIIQGYGLTETSPILTVLDWPSHRRAVDSGDLTVLRSAGRPVAETWLRIVDEHGAALPPGEIGEVLVRGPQVMNGYLDQPEATAEALRDGWLHTGDIGHLDAQGYLYLTDRLKDKIISGGENVYSTEVEAALYAHPWVRECAVIGVPDARLGEALLAVIVPQQGASLDGETLVAHCRERIGGYKIPRRYEFVEVLPKSAMGKILKNELRKHYG